MHDVILRILIELLILYSLVYSTGFSEERLIFYDLFCATKVVWMCIHAYGGEWVKRSTNIRSSAFRDHGKSDILQYAMHLLKKSCSKHITEHAPIVRVLCNMDDDTKSMINKQFDIAYFLTKENLSFNKTNAVYELQELHGVMLGSSYRNRQSSTVFVEYM